MRLLTYDPGSGPRGRLQPGDVVEVEGIGTLRNTLGPASNPNLDKGLRFTAPTQRPLPEPLPAEQLQAVRARTAPPQRE